MVYRLLKYFYLFLYFNIFLSTYLNNIKFFCSFSWSFFIIRDKKFDFPRITFTFKNDFNKFSLKIISEEMSVIDLSIIIVYPAGILISEFCYKMKTPVISQVFFELFLDPIEDLIEMSRIFCADLNPYIIWPEKPVCEDYVWFLLDKFSNSIF